MANFNQFMRKVNNATHKDVPVLKRASNIAAGITAALAGPLAPVTEGTSAAVAAGVNAINQLVQSLKGTMVVRHARTAGVVSFT